MAPACASATPCHRPPRRAGWSLYGSRYLPAGPETWWYRPADAPPSVEPAHNALLPPTDHTLAKGCRGRLYLGLDLHGRRHNGGGHRHAQQPHVHRVHFLAGDLGATVQGQLHQFELGGLVQGQMHPFPGIVRERRVILGRDIDNGVSHKGTPLGIGGFFQHPYAGVINRHFASTTLDGITMWAYARDDALPVSPKIVKTALRPFFEFGLGLLP